MREKRESSPGSGDGIEAVVAQRALRTVFQPIFDIRSRAAYGYEALTRGPAGTALESPTALFAAAAEAGIEPQLDRACQIVAMTSALDAGLRPPLNVFINGELGGARLPDPPPEEAGPWRRAIAAGLPIVFEQTERGLVDDPATLIVAVDRARRAQWRVAMDDVGADPRVLALLPVVDPDVIKIDMNVLHRGFDRHSAEVANAIASEVERRETVVIAEGIETGEQLDRAQAMGATHVQGFLFGRPGDLKLPGANGHHPTPQKVVELGRPLDPFAVMTDANAPTQVGPLGLVKQLSRQLEDQAAAIGRTGMLIGSFRDPASLSARTKASYVGLAEKIGFVGAVGPGMEPQPAPGVRGGDSSDDERIAAQWCVAVIAPHFASGFCARELDAEGRGGERRFEIAITHDRGVVAKSARALLRHVAPLPGTYD